MGGLISVALGLWAVFVGVAAFDRRSGTPARSFRDGRPLGSLGTGLSLTVTDAPVFVLLVAALPGLDPTGLVGLAVGAAAGRLLAGAFFVPRLFLGEQTTAHQRLHVRFGPGARQGGALAFFALRILHCAVVLGLAVPLLGQATSISPATILAAVTLVAAMPTVAAGVRGAVRADRVHAAVVVVAVVGMAATLSDPAGAGAVATAPSVPPPSIPFLAALLGGAAWAAAAYATDHLHVQRLLGCGSVARARRAVLVSVAGGLVVAAATPVVLAALQAPVDAPARLAEALSGWIVLGLVGVSTAVLATSASATASVLIYDVVRPSVDGSEPRPATTTAARGATIVALLGLGAAGFAGMRAVPAHLALEVGTAIYGVSLGLAALAALRLSDPMRGSPGSFVLEPVDAAVTLALAVPAVVWMAWTSDPAFSTMSWPLALPLYAGFVAAVGLVVRNLRKAVWDRRI